MTAPVVTVDGPAGSGKTTLGRRLALALGLPLLDTGLLYRGLMVAAVRAGLDASDVDAITALAKRTRIEVDTDPLAPESTALRVDGRDAGTLARDPARARLLAQLSSLPAVRAVLLVQQRRLAANGAVAVGRDCGTVVFPQAPVKFYLEAAPEVRASRRAVQLATGGAPIASATLDDEVAQRDRLDTGRAASPLRPAADAHIIDTGVLGVEEMVEEALRYCREAGLRTTS